MDGVIIEQTKMRTAIAKRMVDSKQQAPHFYVETEIATDALREAVDGRTTMTVAFIRATVHALTAHPKLNSVWTPGGLLQASAINLGVAIALDDGLVAPALLGADALDFDETATALRDLVDRARAARLRPAEMTDATFTLSNLGMFDVSGFTAIVTPPQVAILAVARPVESWALIDSQPVRRSLMTATLSCDHRALDGVDAARFLETLKHSIEEARL